MAVFLRFKNSSQSRNMLKLPKVAYAHFFLASNHVKSSLSHGGQELLKGWERLGVSFSGAILQTEHKETVKEYVA